MGQYVLKVDPEISDPEAIAGLQNVIDRYYQLPGAQDYLNMPTRAGGDYILTMRPEAFAGDNQKNVTKNLSYGEGFRGYTQGTNNPLPKVTYLNLNGDKDPLRVVIHEIGHIKWPGYADTNPNDPEKRHPPGFYKLLGDSLIRFGLEPDAKDLEGIDLSGVRPPEGETNPLFFNVPTPGDPQRAPSSGPRTRPSQPGPPTPWQPKTIGPQSYSPEAGESGYRANADTIQPYAPGGPFPALDPSWFNSGSGPIAAAGNRADLPGGNGTATQIAASNAGRVTSRLSDDGTRRDYFIDYGGNLPPVQLPRVQANEIAYGIDGLADQIDTSGLKGELQTVYHDLNSPDSSQTAEQWTPNAAGIKGSDVDREYMTNAIRAYMADPQYMQTVAPDTAAAIQATLNANPQIASSLQPSQIMPFLTGGADASAGAANYDWGAAGGGVAGS